MSNPTTRRHFLSATVAAPFAAAWPALARAGGRDANFVRPVDLNGIVPADHVVGGVLFPLKFDYLVFDAVQTDNGGRSREGIAAVRLDSVLSRRIRMTGDEDLPTRTVDYSTLESQTVYEVYNSTWVQTLVKKYPKAAARAAAPLRHYIVTFSDVGFEWVGTKLNPLFAQLSFEEVRGYLEVL